MSTRTGQQRTGPYAGRTRNPTAARLPRALRSRRLTFLAVVAVVTAWLIGVTTSDGGTVSREFAFRSSPGRFIVPSGVCRVRVEAAGASGGLAGAAGTPGLGIRLTVTIPVVPAETLVVYVGGQGGTAEGATRGRGGWNGGGAGGAAVETADGRRGSAGSGGGGATDVRRGAGTLADRILVAGGGAGGGGGGIGGPYGIGRVEGESANGSNGYAPLGSANPVTGGRGGAQRVGGGPGGNAPDGAVTATGGSLGIGGTGAGGGVNGGGGGGGGLYGGGGGGTEVQWTTDPLGAAHGGGGSSFGPNGASFRSGVWGNLGDGRLTISYDPAEDACAQ